MKLACGMRLPGNQLANDTLHCSCRKPGDYQDGYEQGWPEIYHQRVERYGDVHWNGLGRAVQR